MSTDIIVTNEELIESVQGHFPDEDINLLRFAWAFAEKRYASLEHPTGKPYLAYVLGIAKILADLGSAPIVIAATIIFPPLPQYRKVFPDLKTTFSNRPELVQLVEEIFSLSNLEWDVWPEYPEDRETILRKEVLLKMFLLAIDTADDENHESSSMRIARFQKREKQVENIIRMFLASVTDIRALIIKLADRLYFMRLLKNLSIEEKRAIHYIRLARISLTIYAHLADRLGLWRLKSELEDMSFRLLDMEAYKSLAGQLAARKEQREQIVDEIILLIQAALAEYGIQAEISGRAKHIYSIYRKMEARQLTLEQINDLLGIRIIVSIPEECYFAQEIIHAKWPPKRSFYDGDVGRDWIVTPKENGYQSLHTTIEIKGRIVEVQIRTHEMHETAEYGTATEHWRYKDPKLYRKGKTPRVTKEREINWGVQLVELRKNINNQLKIADLMQKGLLKDRVFTITPVGHVIDFPKGVTPLDFAYRIHTDLGHRFTGAKVGGRIVPLSYQLKNGDIVELITTRARSGPNPEWLTTSKNENGKSAYIFAKTRSTREKIRSWLKENAMAN